MLRPRESGCSKIVKIMQLTEIGLNKYLYRSDFTSEEEERIKNIATNTAATTLMYPENIVSGDIYSDITFNQTITVPGGGSLETPVSLANGGTGSALSDPNANRIFIWDDVDNATVLAVIGTGLTYTAATNTLASSGGGGSPGGSDTYVQYNDSSAFGGDENFTWDKTGFVLTIGAADESYITSGLAKDFAIQTADTGSGEGTPGTMTVSGGTTTDDDENGGGVNISGGGSSGDSVTAGDIAIEGGAAAGTGTAGGIEITAGSSIGGTGGGISINGGVGVDASGSIFMSAGNNTDNTGGQINMSAGTTVDGLGGNVIIGAGSAFNFTDDAAGDGGNVLIAGGGVAGDGVGGYIQLIAGATIGGTSGYVQIAEFDAFGTVQPNLALSTNTPTFGGGRGVFYIHNRTTAPSSDPTSGGLLYVVSGALTYRGSSGTITTIAVA